MFQPKSINPNFLLVKINREEQRQKRERIGSILLNPNVVHMDKNMQMGEVVAIGRNVPRILPEIELGDTALFSHVIEGTVSTTEANKPFNNEWLIYEDEEWRYYMVRSVLFARDTEQRGEETVVEIGEPKPSPQFLYGCMKKGNGAVYMTEFYTFALASPEEQDNREMKKITVKGEDGKEKFFYVFKDYKEERKEIEDRLQKLKLEAETHRDRTELLQHEMETLTRSLNIKRAATFVPVFTSDKLRKEFGCPLDTTWILYYSIIGSKGTPPQVTQMAIGEYSFYVLRNDYIMLAKKMAASTLEKLVA